MSNKEIIEIDGQAYRAIIEDNSIVEFDECTPYNKTPAGMLQKELNDNAQITAVAKCAHIPNKYLSDALITIGYYCNNDEIEIVEISESKLYVDAVYIQWDNVGEEAYDEPEPRENKESITQISEGALFE